MLMLMVDVYILLFSAAQLPVIAVKGLPSGMQCRPPSNAWRKRCQGASVEGLREG